jgi:tRNA-uridine 2-sulfurtransferase
MVCAEVLSRKKVLAAMSGGVDSSVAALLLCEAGYDVTGVTMSLGIHQEGMNSGRFTDDAIADAARVCDQLQIRHLIIGFAASMEKKVISKFTAEYLAGRTPNPCVDCNRYLKFGVLLKKARELGFDYLATGHYARIEKNDDDWHLLRAKDKVKDQSYFLYQINVDDLSSILFPLGSLTKEDVRALAKKAGLSVAQRAESQDICFVPQGNYRKVFLDRNLFPAEGEIVDMRENILGRHRGIVDYTIGQRGGLGISAKMPLYVVAIETQKNRVIVGQKKDLQAWGLIAADLNLLVDKFPAEVKAKIRYRKKPSSCYVTKKGEKMKVIFKEIQEAITPGQAVVFYGGDEVLGGGVIEEVIREIN